MASQALRSFRPGFEVATAETMDDALAWFETFTPDVLVVDVSEASGDAFDLIEKVRREIAPRLRVLGLGPDDRRLEKTLAKPVSLPGLLDGVRALYDG